MRSAVAQCSNHIVSYPYYESFQTSDGGWFSGGTNSDWVWGAINKQLMPGKGWCIGGLQGSSYSNGENSWLQSPCFDFSGLINPQISFKISWETERKYDGASFQYSSDNGTTWLTVGSTADAANCLTGNWFNNNSITYLGTEGWSGNIQPNSGSCLGGSGSNGWVIAKHDLANLAGLPNVIFRFTFGAGTACNSYQGFAVDDILINERSTNTSNFIYNCGQNNIVSFINTSSSCAETYSWNFGDPVSGTSNTASAQNVDHTFSSAGTYNVSLTVTFSGNTIVTTTKAVTVLNAAITSSDVSCWGGSNGEATVNVSGGNGSYSYVWNTNPVQTTAIATLLKAGSYIVTVNSPQACTITAPVTITQPAKLATTLQATDEKCGKHEGFINSSVNGGVQPYSYLWSNGSTTSLIQNLSTGNYDLTVTDANACTVNSTAVVKNVINQLNLFLGNDTTICPGEQLILSPGNFSAYLWQNGSAGNTYTVTQTGNYSVKVTDADGCTATDAIHVTVDCSDIYFPTAFTPNSDGRNDAFGAAGNVSIVKNYSLKVYSRWADMIFKTTDPYKGWDGKIKSLDANSGTFVWVAEYELLGKKRIQRGTLTLLR